MLRISSLKEFKRSIFVDKIFHVINYLFLTALFIIVGYPLLYVLVASFSSARALNDSYILLWPKDFNLESYKVALSSKNILIGYANSLYYMIVGTSINIVMTITAGYALSFKDFLGRRFVIYVFLITMFFSGGLMPTYFLIRNLGMYNSRWALIIPGAMSVWNVIITRTFFESSLPESLFDAAYMDGCSQIKFLWYIAIPLSTAIIAVNAVYYSVGHWNQYFGALIYLQDRNKFPLQLFLREILVTDIVNADILPPEERLKLMDIAQGLKYALIVLSSLPVLFIYPFVQKHFVKGVMIGSLKS